MNFSENKLSPDAVLAPETPSHTLLLPDETPTYAWLVALNGPRRGKLYRIPQTGLTIGRTEDNTIILADETVSRHHLRLTVEPSPGSPQVYIQDMASANGAFVNGVRIVRQLLHDEDRITVGDTLFAFKHL